MTPRVLPMALLLTCMAAVSPAQSYPRQSEVERGRYLATAGDCMACHSDAEHPVFSGNRAIPTPFGTIYSANITPDRETGIGTWTQAQFYRALHDGIAADGSHLYPAMPYTNYTKLSRADVDAMYAYFQTVPAVRNETKSPELIWPMNWRFLMTFWDWLFFDEGAYQADRSHDAQWNRGAYLVQGAGHCGACHTPRNLLGAGESSAMLQGGVSDHWFAPPLVGNPRDGLGSWTGPQIVQFLKTGRNTKTAAFGPMGEVVADSTRYMTDGDLAVIATFLRSQAPTHEDAPGTPDNNIMQAGGELFGAQCAACHQAEGKGVSLAFATLQGSANAQARNPDTVIRAILTGVRAVSTARQPTGFAMPSFDWKLDNAQVAAVATFIGNSWGNAAPPVSASDVATMRGKVGAKSQLVSGSD